MFETVVDLHKIIDQIKIAGEPVDSETMMGIIMGTNDEFQDPTKMGKLRDLKKYRAEILTKVVGISEKINTKLGKITEKDIENMADPFGINEIRNTAKKDLEKHWEELRKKIESVGIADFPSKTPFNDKKSEADNTNSDGEIKQKIYDSNIKKGISDEAIENFIKSEELDKEQEKALREFLKTNSIDQLNSLQKLEKSFDKGDVFSDLFTTIIAGIVDKMFGTKIKEGPDAATSYRTVENPWIRKPDDNTNSDGEIKQKIYASNIKKGISDEAIGDFIKSEELDREQEKALREFLKTNSIDQLNSLQKHEKSFDKGDVFSDLFTTIIAGIVALLFGVPVVELIDKMFGTNIKEGLDSATSHIKQYSGFILDGLKLLALSMTAIKKAFNSLLNAVLSPIKTLRTVAGAAKVVGTAIVGTTTRAISSVSSFMHPKTETVENPWIRKPDGKVSWNAKGEKGFKTKAAWEAEHGVSANEFKEVKGSKIKIPIKETTEKLAEGAEKAAVSATENSAIQGIEKTALKGVAKAGFGGLLKKGLGFILNKKIPIIGALLEFATVISDLRQGDFVGATLRTIGGIANLLMLAGPVGAAIGIPLGLAVDFLDDMITQKAGGDPKKKSFGMIPDILGTIVDSIGKWAIDLLKGVADWWTNWWTSPSDRTKTPKGTHLDGNGKKEQSQLVDNITNKPVDQPDNKNEATKQEGKDGIPVTPKKPSSVPTPKISNPEKSISSKESVDDAAKLAEETQSQNQVLELLSSQTGLSLSDIQGTLSKSMGINLNSSAKVTPADVSGLADISAALPKSIGLDQQTMQGFTSVLSNTMMSMNQPTPSLSIGSSKGDEAIITGSRGDHIYMNRTKWFNKSEGF